MKRGICLRIILVMASSSVILLLVFFYSLYSSYHKTISNPFYYRGLTAVWLRHNWVGKPHTENEYRQLFDKLKLNGISDAYFHVGPWLDSNGGISKEKYKYADELIINAHKMFPKLRLHAWIGQMTKNGGGPLDLSDSAIRNKIAATARLFLDIGFDGVHYDFEPVYAGDLNFIDLLKNTKKITNEKNKYLSVASGQLELIPFSGRIIRTVAPKASIWNKDYFLSVAANVDQVAVMLYDTALPTDWLYGIYVKKQTEELVPLLYNTTLFIGVPTYEDDRPGHHPRAENIHTAIRSIKMGLNRIDDTNKKNFGVAIFAEWTTDENEWEIYRREWLEQ